MCPDNGMLWLYVGGAFCVGVLFTIVLIIYILDCIFADIDGPPKRIKK